MHLSTPSSRGTMAGTNPRERRAWTEEEDQILRHQAELQCKSSIVGPIVIIQAWILLEPDFWLLTVEYEVRQGGLKDWSSIAACLPGHATK